MEFFFFFLSPKKVELGKIRMLVKVRDLGYLAVQFAFFKMRWSC